MSRPWILISPSSRGIGAALTTHLLRTTPLPILATARHDVSAVRDSFLSAPNIPSNAGERLHVVELDVTKESTISAAAKHAADLFPPKHHHLHLALAIPGILFPEKSPAQVDYDKALETYKVNTLGPLMLMKHFFDFLPRKSTRPDMAPDCAASLPAHATWLAMSARVGSVSDNRAGGWYSYRSSKAAVTSLAKSLDNFLRSRSGDSAMAIAYHPGTTKTELSRAFWDSVPQDTLLEPDFAAQRLVEVVSGLGVEQRGKFYDWKGEEVLP